MITERVRRRYEHLCKLAARPGTPAEGDTARFILGKMLERYPELVANLPPIPAASSLEWRERETSVTRYPHMVAVGFWAPARKLRIDPVRERGRIVSCSMIDGDVHFSTFRTGAVRFELEVNGALRFGGLVRRSRDTWAIDIPVERGDELTVSTNGYGRRSLEVHFSFVRELRG